MKMQLAAEGIKEPGHLSCQGNLIEQLVGDMRSELKNCLFANFQGGERLDGKPHFIYIRMQMATARTSLCTVIERRKAERSFSTARQAVQILASTLATASSITILC